MRVCVCSWPSLFRFLVDLVFYLSHSLCLFLSSVCMRIFDTYSDGISETYTTPAPNHWGIPLNAEPYTHNKFPTKLNAAFLTPVRRPRLLVKEGSETTRANDQGSKTANMISNTMVHRQQHTDQYHGVGNPNGMDHDSSNDINNSNSGVDVVFHNDAAMEMFLGEAQLSVITVKKWITQFQAIVRMRFQRRLFLARFAELKRLMEMVALKTRIYNFVRMAICRIRYKKCCFRLRRMQALFRGARCYRKYKRVLALVLRAQTCFRRHRAAKFQWARNISLIVTIRGYLVGMWNIGAVPLVDRSRFWYFAGVVASTQFADLVRGCSNSSSSDTSKMTRAAVGSAAYPRCYCSYLALAIHVTEFNRMFTALGWTFREGTRGNGGGNSSNGNNSNAHSYHRLSLRLEIVANGNLVSSTSLPALASAPARALATEREELYKTMKATMDDDKAASVGGGASAKTSLFSAFQLSATKKRKQALAQALWILPLPQVRGGGDGNSNHVDSSFSKTSDVSARVVLKILSVREATLYSASAMPVDAAVVTPSLAAFIAVCKRVDNAAAGSAGSSSVVPVEVSQMDKLWLLGAYCSRITGACYEHARLCAPAMALVVLQHRELRVRQAECVAIKSSLQFLGLGSSMNGATSSTGGRRRRSSVSAAAGASAAVGLIRRESRAFSVNYETSDGIISTSRGKNTPVGSPVPASRLMF